MKMPALPNRAKSNTATNNNILHQYLNILQIFWVFHLPQQKALHPACHHLNQHRCALGIAVFLAVVVGLHVPLRAAAVVRLITLGVVAKGRLVTSGVAVMG